MINYLRFAIKMNPFSEYLADILAYELGAIGFESFELQEDGVSAFIQEPDWKGALFSEVIHDVAKLYETQISFKKNVLYNKIGMKSGKSIILSLY